MLSSGWSTVVLTAYIATWMFAGSTFVHYVMKPEMTLPVEKYLKQSEEQKITEEKTKQEPK